jgi:hypothetical protein
MQRREAGEWRDALYADQPEMVGKSFDERPPPGVILIDRTIGSGWNGPTLRQVRGGKRYVDL